MRRFSALSAVQLALVAVLLAGAPRALAAEDRAKLVERVQTAHDVYRELIATPDRDIPNALLEDCRCIAVIPHVVKGAIGFGARFGKGVVTCRDAGGSWSPLAFFKLTGGSWGLQLGAEANDVVLFFMTERGAKSLLESKFTLGGKLGVAAGPVGRSAEASTDAKLTAEIYSYARSKGLFAGISLEGARLAPDTEANQTFYGEAVTAKQILFDRQVPRRPEESDTLLRALP